MFTPQVPGFRPCATQVCSTEHTNTSSSMSQSGELSYQKHSSHVNLSQFLKIEGLKISIS